MQPIAKSAVTILINLSSDEEILSALAEDEVLIENILKSITVCHRFFDSLSEIYTFSES